MTSKPTKPEPKPAADDPLRARLRSALAGLAEEQQRLSALTAAFEKARAESRPLADKITEAEAALAKARAEESSRLAYEFAAGGITAASPVSAIQRALEETRAEHTYLERVAAALDQELTSVRTRLQRRQAAVAEALTGVVLDSDAFERLHEEQAQLWARLRGVRKAFRNIQRELHGFMPQPETNRWMATVSLDPDAVRDTMGPIVTDETLVIAWREALSRLRVDPDAELPG